MDEKVWSDSKRGFPFNIPLQLIVFSALLTPCGLAVALIDFKDTHLRDVFGITLILSLIGYYAASKAIDSFKDNLRDKNLFGIDLNKAGKREDKPKV